MDMQELVDILVVEVFVYDSVYRHQVLYNCVSHGESRLNMFTAVLIIGHLEGELARPIHTVCCCLIIFVKYAKCMVFPVKLWKDVETVMRLLEIHVGFEEISAMDAELILFTMMEQMKTVLIWHSHLVLQLLTLLIMFISCIVGVLTFFIR